MGAASLQEKVLKVADEVEKLKEELSDVKYRLQKKKEELKALKKLASEPQSQEQEIEQEATIDLSKNEIERILLYDNLKINDTNFVCSLPSANLPTDSDLLDSSQFFSSSDTPFFHDDVKRRGPLSFTAHEPRAKPPLSHSGSRGVMSRATGMLLGLSPGKPAKRDERDHDPSTPNITPRYPSPLKKVRPFKGKAYSPPPRRLPSPNFSSSSSPTICSPGATLLLPPASSTSPKSSPSFGSSRGSPSSQSPPAHPNFSQDTKGPSLSSFSQPNSRSLSPPVRRLGGGQYSSPNPRSRSPVPFSQVQRSMRSSNLTTIPGSFSPPDDRSMKQTESAPKISLVSSSRELSLKRERGKRSESDRGNLIARERALRNERNEKRGEREGKGWKDSYAYDDDEASGGEEEKERDDDGGHAILNWGGGWEHTGASYMLNDDIPDPTPYLLYEVDKSEGDQSDKEGGEDQEGEAKGEKDSVDCSPHSEGESVGDSVNYSLHSAGASGGDSVNYSLHSDGASGGDSVNYSLHSGDTSGGDSVNYSLHSAGASGGDSINYSLHSSGSASGGDSVNYSLHSGDTSGGDSVNYSLHSGDTSEGDRVNHSLHSSGRTNRGDNVNYSLHSSGGEDEGEDVNYSLHVGGNEGGSGGVSDGDNVNYSLHAGGEEPKSSPEPSGRNRLRSSVLVGVERDSFFSQKKKASRVKSGEVKPVQTQEKKVDGGSKVTKQEREITLEAVKKGLSDGDRWSERFQYCLQKLRNLGNNSDQEEKVNANTELMHLSEDFVCASRAVGKIIISEVYLPFEDKVIKPTVDLGGQAGGDKYMVHNILFKFALDSMGLFGGSDIAAAKVSGHELKGLMAYFSVGMHYVNFPLMTLVDYRGFRLVAISVLPVGKNTIVYGTADGGRSYHNSDRKFSKEMDEAAEKLNLKSHLCGSSKFRMVRLAAAADIEGHRGVDGKFYLLDFSRTMPPVAPQVDKYYNGHLYYLFRREFVRANSKPLCSDAFSGFISQDRNAKKHNLEVEEATQKLLTETIPQYAKSLYQSALNHTGVFHFDVTAHMHKTGVNVRYIGLVVKEFDGMKEKNQKLISPMVGSLLIEAVARVVKNDLNLQMRQETKKLMLPLEVPYRKLAVDYMNKVFGRGKASENWWHNLLPPLLSQHFNVEKEGRMSDLRQFLLMGIPEGRVTLFRRILGLTGLVFSENIMKKFADRSIWMSEPVDYLDLIEMGERVKCMDIVSLSQGNFFLYKALGMPNGKVKEDLLLQAISKYEEALNSNANKETLMNCSIAHFNYLTSKADRMGWVKEGEEIYFAPADIEVQRAESHFQRLVSSDKNGKTLCLYAMFLVRCQEFVKAESHFIRSLQASPSPYTLTEYLYFLDRCRVTTFAEHTYRCIVEKTTHNIVSPFTGKELGGIIKVFTENGSFKSMKITGVTSSCDVLVMISNALKVKYDHERWQLVGVDAGVPLRHISDESWKDEEEWERVVESEKKIIFKPYDLPWIYLQRPHCPYFLYLRRVPSPSSFEAIGPQLLLAWAGGGGSLPSPQHSSLRKKDLVADLLFPSASSSSSHDPPLEHLLTLLFLSPLLIPIPELKEKLLQTPSSGNGRSAKILELWSLYFIDDLTRSDIDSFLQEGGEGGGGGLDGEKFGRMKERRGEEGEAYLRILEKMVGSSLPSTTQAVRRGGEGGGGGRDEEVELDSLSVSALLFPTSTASIGDKEEEYLLPPPHKTQLKSQQMKERGRGREIGWKIRDIGKEEIEELAKILRLWAFFVQFPVVERDFLLFGCALSGRGEIPYSLFMALSYEYLISKWVMREVLGQTGGTPPSPSHSLQSFSLFTDLAIESCKIGDISTSSAIIDALNSDKMHIAQLSWGNIGEHRVVRTKYESCVPYIYFASSAEKETGEYLSLYENAIQVLRKEGGVFLTSYRRLCLYITSLGGVVEEKEGGGGGGALSGVVGYVLYDLVYRYGVGGLQRGKGGCLAFLDQVGGMFGGEGGGGLQKELCFGPLRQIALYFLRTDRIRSLLHPQVPFLLEDERMAPSSSPAPPNPFPSAPSSSLTSFSSARQRLSFMPSEFSSSVSSRSNEGERPLSARRKEASKRGKGVLSREASTGAVGERGGGGRSRGLFRQFTEMTLRDDQ